MIELRLLGSVELRDGEATPVLAVLSRPKCLAVLAYLALAQPGCFHRRDALLAIFWPERDAMHGRAALRKVIHHLRRALGAGAIVGRGEEELGIGVEALWCDAVAFGEALSRGRREEALALYRGPLLPAFYLTGTPEFERWLEAEREQLHRRAVRAASALTTTAPQASASALEWARRAAMLAPEDGEAQRRLLALLLSRGEHTEAVRLYREHSRRLATEYGLDPDPETRAMIEGLRDSHQMASLPTPLPRPLAPGAGATASLESAASVPPPASVSLHHAVAAVVSDQNTRRSLRRPRSRALLIAILALVAAVAVAWLPRLPTRVAIGEIRDFSGMDSTIAAVLLPDLLATSLARNPRLHVVSPARVRALVDQDLGSAGVPTLHAAARLAGAEQVLEGALYRRPDGTLRLDLRRTHLRNGRIVGAHSVIGADAFGLAECAGRSAVHDPGTAPDPPIVHCAPPEVRLLSTSD